MCAGGPRPYQDGLLGGRSFSACVAKGYKGKKGVIDEDTGESKSSCRSVKVAMTQEASVKRKRPPLLIDDPRIRTPT
jgi:hypothetical protein